MSAKSYRVLPALKDGKPFNPRLVHSPRHKARTNDNRQAITEQMNEQLTTQMDEGLDRWQKHFNYINPENENH